MRRDVLIRGIERLKADIETSSVSSMLEQVIDSVRREKSDGLKIDFDVFQRLSIAYSQYTSIEIDIIAIFDLGDIFSPSYWSKISSTPEPPSLYQTRSAIHFFLTHVSKLVDLLQFSVDGKVQTSALGKSSDQLIHVVLPEEEGVTTPVDRVVTAIQAVTGLYEVASTLEASTDATIAIASLDSGSDKAITFVGAGDIAKAVRGMISDIWDRVLLGGATKSAAEIGLIADSLPVFSSIAEREAAGTLQREEAEILRRTLLKSVTGVIKSGSITAEIEQRELPTPRALVHQRQLLLSAPNSNNQTNKGTTADPATRSSRDAEIELLRAEVEALKSVKNAAPARPRRRTAKNTSRTKKD
nr:hypothetical protein [uncultured Sphingomonas sp.]